MTTTAKQEIINQGLALAEMGIETIDGINAIAGEMRDILNSFEDEHNRVPTCDEIVWILSDHHHKNMRKA
jgi:hypothetical protein